LLYPGEQSTELQVPFEHTEETEFDNAATDKVATFDKIEPQLVQSAVILFNLLPVTFDTTETKILQDFPASKVGKLTVVVVAFPVTTALQLFVDVKGNKLKRFAAYASTVTIEFKANNSVFTYVRVIVEVCAKLIVDGEKVFKR
jgi:hypothetical protein